MADGDVEQVFWSIKIEVLEDLRDLLVKDVQPHKYFDYLRSKRVLDRDDCEEIQAEKTRKRQASVFLDILSQKGPDAFDQFCEALRRGKTQIHVLQMLLNAFEVKRMSVFDSSPISCSEDLTDDVSTKSDKTSSGATFNCLPHPGGPGAPAIPLDSKQPTTNKDNGSSKLDEVDLTDQYSGGKVPDDPPPPYTE